MIESYNDEREAPPEQEPSPCILNPLKSGDLLEMLAWLQQNRGAAYEQLTIDELGGVPSTPEDVRKVPFLKLKMQALEQAGLGFYISNGLSDRYEYLSPAFLKLFNVDQKDARSISISDFSLKYYHPEDLLNVLQVVGASCLQATPNSSSSVHITSRYILPHRGLVWLECWQTLYFDEKRRPAFGIGVFQDVTAQKAIELERDRLLDCIIHDIRNPIMVFQGYLSLIKMELEEPNSHEKVVAMLERMSGACAKMTTMANNMLQVRRFGQEIRNSDFQLLDINEFLQSRLQDYQALAKRKEINLWLDAPNSLGSGRIQPNLIEQVLENLITNALKFSHRGGQIVLAAQRTEEGLIQISVTDQGVGIPLEDIPNLFLDYTKVGSQSTEGEVSNGIGLSICKRIVEQHNGTIWCESTLGKGTRMVFTLGEPSISNEKAGS